MKFNRSFFIALIFLRSTLYWFVWLIFRPEMPHSVALFYRERGQDIEYLPYVSGLMKHGLRDAYDYLAHGTGVVTFPFGSVWLHSIFFKFMGVTGFFLADFLVALASFILLSAILKEFKVRETIANIVSLLVVIGASGKLAGLSMAAHQLLGVHAPGTEFLAFFSFLICVAQYFFRKKCNPYFLIASGALVLFLGAHETWEFFTWRFPRPFVTVVYFMSFLLVMLKMQVQKNIFSEKKYWIYAGVVASFLVQSEIYAFFFCGMLFSVLAISQLNKKINILAVVKSVAWFLFPFLILSIPFFVQRFNENPEVPRRFGLYAISRLSPYFKEISTHDFYFATLIVFLCTYVFSYYKNIENKLAGIFWSYLLTFFAMPLFILFTGKVILPGHFYDQMRYVTTLITIVILSMLLSKFADENWDQTKIKFKREFMYGVVALIALVDIVKDTHKNFQFSEHTRNDFAEYSKLPNYQKNFAELVKTLEGAEYSDKLSLATYDMQVTEWWMAIKQGRTFNSDTFASSLSDDELEKRLIVINRLLGFNADEFIDFLNQRMTSIFFFTGVKYQFNKGHQFSSWNDYLPEDQRGFEQTSILSSFNVAIPISERNRIKNKFSSILLPEKKDMPDLIILQKHPSLDQKEPDRNLYMLTFSNEIFRCWKKK